jgi:hypothetical protein
MGLADCLKNLFTHERRGESMKSRRQSQLSRFCRIGFLGLGVFLMGPACSHGQQAVQQEKMVVTQKVEWQVLATSPGVEVVIDGLSNPGRVLTAGQNARDAAQNWLLDKNLEEGRNLVDGKLVYVSVGAATVNARYTDPAFIDSRFLAFQRADLEAKAKTAIFLGVDLSTSRGSMEREINPQERAELEEIVNASPEMQANLQRMGIRDTVYSLFDKATRLMDAKLDKALKESGVDVAAEAKQKQATEQAKRDRLSQLRNISDASFKAAACAFADVQGTQVIQAFEGSYHGNYQVVVITLWSQNLQRLVDIMKTGTAVHRMPLKQANQEVSRQLPTNPNELACLTGVRAYINQRGEHVLLAFGQAGVEVIGGRQDKAFELADKKARNRAMAAIRAFMGEKLAFAASEKLREALALYANEYQPGGGTEEYRSISQFQEMIAAQAERQKISGIHGLANKELKHPFTDRPMVLSVMAWSPASQEQAKGVGKAIEKGADAVPPPPPPPQSKPRPQDQVPGREGVINSGQGADKRAY